MALLGVRMVSRLFILAIAPLVLGACGGKTDDEPWVGVVPDDTVCYDTYFDAFSDELVEEGYRAEFTTATDEALVEGPTGIIAASEGYEMSGAFRIWLRDDAEVAGRFDADGTFGRHSASFDDGDRYWCSDLFFACTDGTWVCGATEGLPFISADDILLIATGREATSEEEWAVEGLPDVVQFPAFDIWILRGLYDHGKTLNEMRVDLPTLASGTLVRSD